MHPDIIYYIHHVFICLCNQGYVHCWKTAGWPWPSARHITIQLNRHSKVLDLVCRLLHVDCIFFYRSRWSFDSPSYLIAHRWINRGTYDQQRCEFQPEYYAAINETDLRFSLLASKRGSPGGTFYSGGFGLKDHCYLRVSWGIDSLISTVVVMAQRNLKERNIR